MSWNSFVDLLFILYLTLTFYDFCIRNTLKCHIKYEISCAHPYKGKLRGQLRNNVRRNAWMSQAGKLWKEIK